MWVEEEKNKDGKKIYRFREEYTEKRTGKTRKVSVTYARNNKRIQQKALLELQEIISERENKSASSITFNELAMDWFSEHSLTVKPSTAETYKGKIKKFDDLGDTLLSELEYVDINRFLRRLKNKGFKKTTVSIYATVIKAVVEFGLNYGDLNDVDLINLIKLPSFEKEKNHVTFLEQSELDSLVKQLRDFGYYELARMALLQTNTGMRNGELTSLNYEKNIDWDNQTILIERTYIQSTKSFNLPKNGKVRTISFNDEAKELLKEQIQFTKLKTMQYGLNKEPILFKNTKGNPVAPSGLRYAFNKVDIPGKHISSHIFRHTFITRAIELGIPVHLIAQHVGNTPTTIERSYRHFSKNMGSQLKDQIEKLSFGS